MKLENRTVRFLSCFVRLNCAEPEVAGVMCWRISWQAAFWRNVRKTHMGGSELLILLMERKSISLHVKVIF